MESLQNILKTLLLLFFIVLYNYSMVEAQIEDTYEYRVDLPVENTGRNLELDFYRGLIHIKAGYPDAKELEIKSAILDYNKYINIENPDDSLQLFKTNSIPDLNIETDSNSIRISNSTQRNIIYIEIAVPPSFSVQASTAHLGRFMIKDISGNLDLNNYSGNIYLHDVAGAISAQSTRNGSISVKFVKIKPQNPIVLTTYGGNLNLSLPAETGADLRMRSELGIVESDFPIDQTLQTSDNLASPPDQNSEPPVNWIDTKLGKGGPLLLLQTIRGDIVIKKSE